MDHSKIYLWVYYKGNQKSQCFDANNSNLRRSFAFTRRFCHYENEQVVEWFAERQGKRLVANDFLDFVIRMKTADSEQETRLKELKKEYKRILKQIHGQDACADDIMSQVSKYENMVDQYNRDFNAEETTQALNQAWEMCDLKDAINTYNCQSNDEMKSIDDRLQELQQEVNADPLQMKWNSKLKSCESALNAARDAIRNSDCTNNLDEHTITIFQHDSALEAKDKEAIKECETIAMIQKIINDKANESCSVKQRTKKFTLTRLMESISNTKRKEIAKAYIDEFFSEEDDAKCTNEKYCQSNCTNAEDWKTKKQLDLSYQLYVGKECNAELANQYRTSIEESIAATDNAIIACKERNCNIDFLNEYKSNLINNLKEMDEIENECKKKEEERQQYCDSKCATAEHFESFEKLKRDYEAVAGNDCDPTLSQRYRMTIETAIGETSNAIGACREKTCNVDFWNNINPISSTR